MSAGTLLERVGPPGFAPRFHSIRTKSLTTSISVNPKSPPAQIVPGEIPGTNAVTSSSSM